MKKKKQPWYSFRLIIPALLVMPPLGFVLLWKSPRTRRAKAVVSVLFLAFLITAFAGAVRTGIYAKYVEAKQPSDDVFDVRMDSRSNYMSHEVLPFERKVFAAVVSQMRSNHDPQKIDFSRDIVDIDTVSAGTKAFEAVGDEYGLDYEDVRKIYRKVSSLLAKK
jgi:hypothetical protein